MQLQPAGSEPLPKLHMCRIHPLHNYISNIYCMSHVAYSPHVFTVFTYVLHKCIIYRIYIYIYIYIYTDIYIYIYLYNKLSYARILIGSHL